MHFEIYGAESPEAMLACQAMGFDRVILDRHALAPVADGLGLGVVLANFWKRTTPWSDIEAALAVAGVVGNLVSINLKDEPEREAGSDFDPKVYRRVRRRIRHLGSRFPLSLTIYGPIVEWPVATTRRFLDYVRSIDQYRMTVFPHAGGKPLGTVWLRLEQARLLLRPGRRRLPITVVLQAWKNPPTGGLPPIAMLRVMAYMVVLAGAEALSFYQFNPSEWAEVPGFAEGFRSMMAEVTALAAEIAGARVSAMLGGDGLFQAEVLRPGRRSCLTINTLDQQNGAIGPLEVVRCDGACPRPVPAPALVQPRDRAPDREEFSPVGQRPEFRAAPGSSSGEASPTPGA